MTHEHDNAQRRAELSAARRALLEQWLQGKAARSKPAQPAIPRRADREAAPLSFPQQRLWFVDQLDPGSAAYNMPGIVHLDGALNIPVLERSLHEIIRRHETLRTSFVQGRADDGPVQRVDPESIVPLHRIDLSDLEPEQQSVAVQQRALEEARRLFDLSSGPLLRMTLARLGPETHLLFLTLHHIIADGWSIGVFVRELSALYVAFSSGQPSPLADLPVQYGDYAAWQRQQAQSETIAEHLAYWKQQLADLPTLQLPTDRPRPAIQNFAGAKRHLWLSASLTQALKALGQQADATLFMTLLAAWQVLLQRYSDQDDIVVGSVTAGRSKRKLEGMIGCFVDNLVLRSDLSGNPSFRELLGRVRATSLSAFAHQDVPFEQLVEALQPDRNLSHAPLFQVMFVLQPGSTGALELPGLALRLEEGDTGTAKFDLTLSLEERSDEISGWIEYSRQLFDASTIERMAWHFQILLEAIVAQPERGIRDLAILTAAERDYLLHDWNATEASYPADQTIDRLFAAQVARTPDRIAVSDADTRLTYHELNEQANRLAHHLRAQGVGPDTLVGVCLHRSTELIVALLAVLKAGGAYLPLDPRYPAERRRFMAQDSGIDQIVTLQSLLDDAPADVPVRVLLDADSALIAAQPTSNPEPLAAPHNLAYCIYTSGSTGQPKGVLLEHSNVVRLLINDRLPFDFSERDVWTMFHSFGFDFSVWEMYGALLYGGRLVVVLAEATQDPALFLDLLRREQVTILNQTPSAFSQLAQAALAQTADLALRYVIFGGEALAPLQLAEWRQAYPHVQLVNMYGITETTVHVTFKEIAEQEIAQNTSSIGVPIPTTTVYVLDQQLRLLPVGIPGEICVGGAGVARGYLNRPELTQQKFVANPYKPGERLYRSGDRARLLPSGELVYLGRLDEQVQIRGFRVELGEIQSRLLAHPAVAEALVITQPLRGETRIVAYLAPTGPISITELRSHLAQTLPDYMIPSAFVTLDALPLTANGKVDRRALPEPDSDRSLLEKAYVAPRSAEEEILATMWAEILGLERVGVYDNFFELGGHSLLATQIASRVRDVFQVELPLRVLFVSPTVAGLAEWIASAQPDRETLPPLRPAPRDYDPPLSFAQQRLWFLHQLQPESASYVIAAAVRLTGALDLAALEQSLNTVAQRHEILRTTFVQKSAAEQPVQRIAPSCRMPLSLHDLTHLPPDRRPAELERQIALAARQPFDLATGPLLRTLVLRLDASEYVLLLTMHHIISDGWSMGVLINELASLYTAAVSGETAGLLDLPIQYADYAIWQRQWLAHASPSKAFAQQIAYWREQLADAPPVLALPTDRPRRAAPTFAGRSQAVILRPTLTESLKRLSRQEGCTLFMTLLAAWQTLLGHYSSSTDIVVGSPIANRNQSETENLIGCFVNTLVLRGNLAGNPSFRELLRRTRATTLAAYAHQDLPFEQLVEALNPARDPSYTPLFQVMFALQNAPLPEIALANLSAQRLDVALDVAKFDLSLTLEDTPQGLAGALEYSVDLFDAPTIERMVEHLTILLEQIAHDPERRIFDVALLTEAEQRLILETWNETAAPYADDLCVHQCFEAQAERTPDAIAVEYNGQSLTYAELNRRANQLAHHLRSQGVSLESRVGVCVERSLELVIGFLGVLKAGGVYVPLDPAYPPERLAFMLADSQIALLLTQKRQLERLAAQQVPRLCLDADWATVAREPDTNPVCIATPDNLAYIIYTSGSTGRPKGVMQGHRGLVNLKDSQIRLLKLGVGSRILQLTSPSFDASLRDLVFALLSGATLYLTDRETLLPGPNLTRLLREQAITDALILPSTLAILPVEDLPLLRNICTGAEKCTAEIVARWKPGRSLFNMYGPTETTIYSTAFACHEDSTDDPPIGKPIENTQVYLLNSQLRPVSVGVIGEIYIGGAGMGRGYVNRPDLTAERFVPNPFANEPGARLYKTGDLARYLPDGNLQYIGRGDQQVKVRGFRIELGEIESALNAHPGVRTSIVRARQTTPGTSQIVAYVVPEQSKDQRTENKEQTEEQENKGTKEQSGAAIPPRLPGWEKGLGGEGLRAFLKEKLPDYMLPSAFMLIDRLPLTPSGKLDERALPMPDKARPELAAAYVSPRTELEQALASIWQELLQIDKVGLHDNFFDLGGHSLLVVQLHGRLNERFPSRLSMIDLFRYSTISALAEYLSRNEAERPQPQQESQLKTVKEGRNWLKQRLGQQRTDKND